MSVFGSIMSKIFRHGQEAAPAQAPQPGSSTPTQTAAASPAPQQATPSAASASQGAPSAAPATPSSPVDVEAVLTQLAGKAGQTLDWRHSIVDLMKLLGLDSSLANRQELAKELHYSGDMHDSAGMNIWLHKQVMTKLAENGGKVPSDLTH